MTTMEYVCAIVPSAVIVSFVVIDVRERLWLRELRKEREDR